MPDERQRRDIDDEDAEACLLARVLVRRAEAEEIQAIAGRRPRERCVVAARGRGARSPPHRGLPAGTARTWREFRGGFEMSAGDVERREIDAGELEVAR